MYNLRSKYLAICLHQSAGEFGQGRERSKDAALYKKGITTWPDLVLFFERPHTNKFSKQHTYKSTGIPTILNAILHSYRSKHLNNQIP